MVKIDLDIARDVLPYFIYKRIVVSSYREYFTFKIDYGFAYWLRAIRIKYPEQNPPVVSPFGFGSARPVSPDLKLEFFDNANFNARQPLPFSASLISSPGKDGCRAITYSGSVMIPEPYSTSAEPAPKSISNLNFLYRYGDIIRIDITGQNRQLFEETIWCPYFIDLLLIGYYVPQKTFEMYGGKE